MNADHQFTFWNVGEWELEDFADTGALRFDKDDPWEGRESQSDLSEPTKHGSTESTVFDMSSPLKLSHEIRGDLTGHTFTTDTTEEEANADGSVPDIHDAWARCRELWEWDLELPGGQTFVSADEGDSFEHFNPQYPDPDPIAEFDPTLGTASYLFDEEIVSLSRTLKVDEWLASINQISDHQRRQISNRLEGFGVSQLRRWLPWLRSQEWTGDCLCLFFEFNEYWQLRLDWWEGAFWDGRMHVWRPTQSSYSLSLDDQLELVRKRLDQPAHRVIDQRWFEDWNDHSLWEREFPYFGKFALFRAGIRTGEDWKTFIRWEVTSYPDEEISRYGNMVTLEYGSVAWFYDSPVAQAPYVNLGW